MKTASAFLIQLNYSKIKTNELNELNSKLQILSDWKIKLKLSTESMWTNYVNL